MKKSLIVKRQTVDGVEIVETSTKKASVLKLYEKALSKNKYNIGVDFNTKSDKIYYFWYFKKGEKLIEVFDIDF